MSAAVMLEAKLDKAGSKTQKYDRYMFGKKGDAVNGGIYVDKTAEMPEEIVLHFKVVKKEVEEDAIS